MAGLKVLGIARLFGKVLKNFLKGSGYAELIVKDDPHTESSFGSLMVSSILFGCSSGWSEALGWRYRHSCGT